jgi:hypothetical protein
MLRNRPTQNKRVINMQFILDLLWDQSRSKYPAAIGGRQAD